MKTIVTSILSHRAAPFALSAAAAFMVIRAANVPTALDTTQLAWVGLPSVLGLAVIAAARQLPSRSGQRAVGFADSGNSLSPLAWIESLAEVESPDKEWYELECNDDRITRALTAQSVNPVNETLGACLLLALSSSDRLVRHRLREISASIEKGRSPDKAFRQMSVRWREQDATVLPLDATDPVKIVMQYAAARRRGLASAADIRAIAKIDRRLYCAMNSIGRNAVFAEGAGLGAVVKARQDCEPTDPGFEACVNWHIAEVRSAIAAAAEGDRHGLS